MTSDVYALQAGPLTQERWAPFGWLRCATPIPVTASPASSSPWMTCT